ncbi:MAG: putative metalloprotease CJM1_0395 family protein [Pontibacterium sp.]
MQINGASSAVSLNSAQSQPSPIAEQKSVQPLTNNSASGANTLRSSETSSSVQSVQALQVVSKSTPPVSATQQVSSSRAALESDSSHTYTPQTLKDSATSETDINQSTEADDAAETELSSAGLTPVEEAQVEELQTIDAEVRQHELAHAAVGGSLAGGIQLEYTRGPDGRMYATSGEVSIDTSTVPGDPEATIDKMRTVIAAAMAPAEPSTQDHRVAAKATAIMVQAQAELAELNSNPASDESGETTESDSEDAASFGAPSLQANAGADSKGNDDEASGDSENQSHRAGSVQSTSQVNPQQDINQRIVNSGAMQPVFDVGSLIQTYA